MVKDFLLTSLIASVVLTVVLNVAAGIAGFRRRRSGQPGTGPSDPDSADWPESTGTQTGSANDISREPRARSQVKVFFPWKTMLVLTIGLTVLINVVGLLTR